MENDKKISVIIPVYNAVSFLDRCIQSVKEQVYQNLEIILVDDGSTDGSAALCDMLAQQDSRIRVIHKSNGGAGSAKNAGFRSASGEFIALVDSDDWIDPEMYMTLMLLMDKEEAQIAVCGIQKVTEGGHISYYYDDLNERKTFSREEALNELPRNEMITNSMCNKLFRAEIIDGLQMDENLAYDDNPFVPQCIAKADKIVYTAEPFYCYYERSGSVSRRPFSIKEFDRVKADRIRLDFYHERFPQCEPAAAISYIGTCLKVFYQSKGNKAVKKEREQLEAELKETIKLYSELPFTKKQKIKAKLFQISPTLYIFSMILRRKK